MKSRASGKAAWAIGLLITLGSTTGMCADAQEEIYLETRSHVYDLFVGWLNAGSMESTTRVLADHYELEGYVKTKGIFEKILRWQGSYAAVGELKEGVPHTQTYLVMETEKRGEKAAERKIVIADDESSRVYRLDREAKRLSHPGGADLMSTLLFLKKCESRLLVHDGEDPYEVHLAEEKPNQRIRRSQVYYSGPAHLCRYQLTTRKNKKRQIDIWLAELDDYVVPARIRVRNRFLPDGVMRLKSTGSSPQS